MAALGFYRFFYILNWIWRIYVNGESIEDITWVAFIGGIVQTGVYLDFLYYWAKSVKEGQQKVSLPL